MQPSASDCRYLGYPQMLGIDSFFDRQISLDPGYYRYAAFRPYSVYPVRSGQPDTGPLLTHQMLV
jgi:hypothetical protein